MHHELMQLITASMSTKKDNAVAPVIGSSSIVEPASVATIASDVTPSIEVEPCVDLHMREVSKSSPCPPLISGIPSSEIAFSLTVSRKFL